MASNDFFCVVQRRRSIRKFSPSPVIAGQLEQILAAVTEAPSAGNL